MPLCHHSMPDSLVKVEHSGDVRLPVIRIEQLQHHTHHHQHEVGILLVINCAYSRYHIHIGCYGITAMVEQLP